MIYNKIVDCIKSWNLNIYAIDKRLGYTIISFGHDNFNISVHIRKIIYIDVVWIEERDNDAFFRVSDEKFNNVENAVKYLNEIIPKLMVLSL